MEKDLGPDVIKTTQTSLGKYVKRPPLSEKLLKKPPFRFLHDVIMTVLKTTGFFEGLFEDGELISDNVKDRDSKILFLSKVISVLGLTIGKSLSVKPSKIVAGQEPEKTNELLQCLAQALDKKLSSDDAVKKYKESSKLLPSTEATKDLTKSIKKSNDTKKLSSKSSEKLSSNKKGNGERASTKNEKTNEGKSRKKENSLIKTESHPKKTHATKTVTNKSPGDSKIQNEALILEHSNNVTSSSPDKKYLEDYKVESKDENINTLQTKEDIASNIGIVQADDTNNIKSVTLTEREKQGKLNSSYTIAENYLNSSLSSQDLMEVENDKLDGNKVSEINVDVINETTIEQISVDHKIFTNNFEFKSKEDDNQNKIKSVAADNDNHESKNAMNETEFNIHYENKSNPTSSNIKSDLARPLSVRPSSSRPGAPRTREKLDNILSETDNLLLGKVNIIVENERNEEEEETSAEIVEQHTDTSSASLDQQEQLQVSSNEHGHLVQQILDSQKEFVQASGKTEIEWQFGAQKTKEASNQEIEQLRINIQALSRVANPLGKLLDHIQEDVEVMRQELQQWTNIYEGVTKEMLKQKSANEDSLLPLQTRLKQLHVEVEEKHDKINDLKIFIHKNSSRIEKLLSNGNVQ